MEDVMDEVMEREPVRELAREADGEEMLFWILGLFFTRNWIYSRMSRWSCSLACRRSRLETLDKVKIRDGKNQGQ